MKRVYLILTLFITSFFFISLNKVNAATYEFTVNESELDYITDDFLKFRELLIEYCNTNNKKYVIVPNTSYPLRAMVFDEDTSGTSYYLEFVNVGSQGYLPFIFISGATSVRYQSDSQSLYIGSTSNQRISFYTTSGPTFTLKYFQDTNLDYIPYTGTVYSVNFKYNDLTYSFSDGELPPSIYKIYSDTNIPLDKFEDEKVLINNFYSIIFIKISNLATDLANNYTFLLIFTIFILIFIIELIRRYLI